MVSISLARANRVGFWRRDTKNFCYYPPQSVVVPLLDYPLRIRPCPQHIKKSAYTTLVRPLLEYSSSVWDPHTKTLVNKIEMVQRRAARFCHNDYKTIEKGCVSEMIMKLNLEPLNIRRTNKRLTIFHKAINGHLALPIGHLQPVLRRTRHLNSKAYNTIHTSKDCYKYSFFPRTIKDWNSLPDKIATIKEPHKFKFALAHFD